MESIISFMDLPRASPSRISLDALQKMSEYTDDSDIPFLSSILCTLLAKSVLDLIEMQRYAMLMFTSCGWFWDEVSRIETVQTMRYAARAMQLARAATGVDLEPQFVRILEAAPSNNRRFGNGGRVYETLVRSAVVEDARRHAGAL